MTASHIFYDGKIIDVSINFEEKTRNNIDIPYLEAIEEPGFQSLIKCIALGSKATFSYKPTLEEIKTFLAKKRRLNKMKMKGLLAYWITKPNYLLVRESALVMHRKLASLSSARLYLMLKRQEANAPYSSTTLMAS